MSARRSFASWLCVLLLGGCPGITRVPLGSDGAGMAAPGRDAATNKPDGGDDDKQEHDDDSDDRESAGERADDHKKSTGDADGTA